MGDITDFIRLQPLVKKGGSDELPFFVGRILDHLGVGPVNTDESGVLKRYNNLIEDTLEK